MTLRKILTPLSRRHAANMASSHRPSEPLVAIMGTTGTGKSDLAVDLARRFNGEVINADAMQMYRGLPIITNQISPEDQKGVPHHLLGTIDHQEPAWTIQMFTREASRMIGEIRSRGRLPIVVGGTNYYIGALLFQNGLVRNQASEEIPAPHRSEEELAAQFPILNAPSDVILDRLREVDPVMASRWHPGEKRKIRRSLEIFLTTGRRASDIYAEQKAEKARGQARQTPWEALMFWVYSKPDVLEQRLNHRVDKMVESGVADEARELHRSLRQRTHQGETVDRTMGIWQSIGFKELEPFLDAEEAQEANTQRAWASGVDDMKTHTRQYARYQLRWLRNKTAPELKTHDALRYLYVLDSSNAGQFAQDVLRPASDICQTFLDGEELPQPRGISTTASEVLAKFDQDEGHKKPVFVTTTCDVCNVTTQDDNQWAQHVNGRKHQNALRAKKRLALTAVEANP